MSEITEVFTNFRDSICDNLHITTNSLPSLYINKHDLIDISLQRDKEKEDMSPSKHSQTSIQSPMGSKSQLMNSRTFQDYTFFPTETNIDQKRTEEQISDSVNNLKFIFN